VVDLGDPEVKIDDLLEEPWANNLELFSEDMTGAPVLVEPALRCPVEDAAPG
jgi:hypothetical protein